MAGMREMHGVNENSNDEIKIVTALFRKIALERSHLPICQSLKLSLNMS